MENLKIIKAGGAVALEQDISGVKGPLLVVEKDGSLRLVETADAGDKLFGAFVRTADGWDLASADVKDPVRSGPKSAGSLPLVAGAPLSLGGYVFVLESSQAPSANVLLWRVGKSRIAADAVLPGRNVVAIDQLTGHESLNPPLVDELLFEFYLTSDGIDTVATDGTRLAVPFRVKFACGTFEGMVLEATEAAAAMKTRDPFGYPSRTIRQGLLLATVGSAAIFAATAFFHDQAVKIETATAAADGIAFSSVQSMDVGSCRFDDAYVFQMSVIRDMSRILGPTPATETADLIARANTLKADPEVNRTVDFLRQVTEIQVLANANRWDDLNAVLAKVDEKTYLAFEAQQFLKDVRELTAFICVDVPREIRRTLFGNTAERTEAMAFSKTISTRFKGNILLGSSAVSSYAKRIARRFDSAQDLAIMHDKLVGSGNYTAEELGEFRSLLSRLDADFDEAGYRSSVAELRAKLADWSTHEVKMILDKYRPGQTDPDVSFARVTPLCDLAEESGVAATTVAEWRKTAREIDRRLDLRYRELYQQYRLGGAMDAESALKIVNEMLEIGGTGGKFRNWAQREKQRLMKEKEVK